MNKLTVQLIEQHPELQQFLGLVVCLLTGATVGLLVYLLRRWRSAPLVGNQMPSWSMDLTQLAVFLVTLFLLVYTFTLMEFGVLSFHLAALISVLFMGWLQQVDWKKYWGPGQSSVGSIVLGSLALAAGIYLPLQGLALLGDWMGRKLGMETGAQPAVELFFQAQGIKEVGALLLFAVVIAPLTEELLFRGFLQPLLKAKLSRGAALGITALAFAALHGHVPTFFPLFALGLLLGLVYEFSGSWWRCVALHACFNGATAGLILLFKTYQT